MKTNHSASCCVLLRTKSGTEIHNRIATPKHSQGEESAQEKQQNKQFMATKKPASRDTDTI
jgi:hypothetical protein